MTDEIKETPPAAEPAPPAEPSTHDAAHASVAGELEEMRRRLDDVEVKADAALLMHLEDDADEEQAAEPERTEVEERTEEPKGEEKPKAEERHEPPADRHSGMFL